MRLIRPALVLFFVLASISGPSSAAPAGAKEKAAKAPFRVVKVLPHFLDKEGRHTVNPSLFDRDAYQYELKERPELRSGMRFDVQWKSVPSAPAALTMRLELRGTKAPAISPVIVTNRAFARGGFSQWTRIPVVGRDYDALGELVAWRVSLWKDDQLVAEKRSFLW